MKKLGTTFAAKNTITARNVRVVFGKATNFAGDTATFNIWHDRVIVVAVIPFDRLRSLAIVVWKEHET